MVFLTSGFFFVGKNFAGERPNFEVGEVSLSLDGLIRIKVF